jgi:hypothetical protein
LLQSVTFDGVSLTSHPPGAASSVETARLPADGVGSYVDPISGRRFVVARPSAQPALWAAYLNGARRTYRRHGVESAIDYDAVRDGRSTALFVAALDADGEVVAGLRVQGRVSRVGQVRALREWAGRPGTAELRAQIAARLPSGVIEVKAVWVGADTDHRTALTAALARAFVHAMDVLQVRYALCTAAAHAVTRWQTSGGVVATGVAAVAYPDERYRTRPMWWDRSRIGELVSDDQYRALTRESDVLFGRAAAVSELPSVA